MFENILCQNVTARISGDISASSLAQAMLFSGPPYSGKGTAALELARALSCENPKETAPWNCGCPGCIRHRSLVSPDLLLLGRRRFYPEIAASQAAFLREGGTGTRMLFIRSLRKLLIRFSPIVWEDDPKLGKIKAYIGDLEEELAEFEAGAEQADPGPSALEKLCGSLAAKAAKLETEGAGELIPIARIRRAAYWSRLAPLGKHKCVIIENAEHMQEGAKNSLLKILEEPPPRVSIILTSSQPKGLLPTMLSRLRPYRFVQRSPQEEAEVLRRIFRMPAEYGGLEGGIEAYLESFLPISGEVLFALGAYFTATVSAVSARILQKNRRSVPDALLDLGKYAGPLAERGGFARYGPDLKTGIAEVLKKTDNFEIPGLLAQFYRGICRLFSSWLRDGKGYPEKTRYAEIWKEEIGRAFTAADLYNITTVMVFERLGENLKNAMMGKK
jgi:DNA polymerase-3 subunit gamma/tau